MSRAALLDHGPDFVALGRVVQPQPGVHALLHRGVAARAAEDERDRRQQALGVQPIDDLRPARRSMPTRPSPERRSPRSRRAPEDRSKRASCSRASRTSSGFTSRLVACGPGSTNRSYIRATDQHVLPQRHRAVLLDDDRGVAADGHQPVAELLGVAHRRRQRHQAHRLSGRWMITSSHTAPRNRSDR